MMRTLAPLGVAGLVGLALSLPLAAQSISTTYVGGNSGTTTWTNQFDINVVNPLGITIIAFDVNCENTRAGGVGSPFTVDVWATAQGGTYVGNETNPAAWTHITRGSGVSGPLGSPTRVDIADFYLATGSYGIALEYNGTAMAYTNGNGTNQSYSNADLTLTLGASTTGRFAAPLYTPRVWNGTIHYFDGNARWWDFGSGCAGAAGVPTIAGGSNTTPQLGSLVFLEVGNLPSPSNLVAVLIGISRDSFGVNPLPMDLSPLGGAGCNLLVSIEGAVTLAASGGIAQLPLAVPNRPALLGAPIHFQAAVVEPAANGLGLVFSAGLTGYIGN